MTAQDFATLDECLAALARRQAAHAAGLVREAEALSGETRGFIAGVRAA